MTTKKKKHRILLWSILIAIILWGVAVNVNYLWQNPFANYEKITDFGKNKKHENLQNHAMALLFYNERSENKNKLATYLRHFDNYKKQEIKMLLIDNNKTPEYQNFLHSLFSEILSQDKYRQALIVFNGAESEDFAALIKDFLKLEQIEVGDFSKQDIAVEEKINKALQEEGNLVIMPADLSSIILPQKDDTLVNEAIYFAQQYSLKANVVDTIDTQLSDFADVSSLLEEYDLKSGEIIEQQKKALKLYAEKYGSQLMQFLRQKLQGKENIKLKDEHFYDRGNIYVEVVADNVLLTAVRKNSAVITALRDIAEQFLPKIKNDQIKSIKIYLLTDLEYVEDPHQMLQSGFLAADDGVWVEYRHLFGLITSDKRLASADSWLNILHQAAGIPDMVVAEDVKYYKFKTVEIEYEN